MHIKNEALKKLYYKLVSSTLVFSVCEESPVDKAFKECDEELSDSVTFAQIKDLQDRNNILEKSNATLLSANLDLASKKRQLEKDLDDAKKQLKYFTQSRDDWRARAKHAEDDINELKKELTATRKDYDELFEKHRKANVRTDCLHEEVKWYRKHYKEQFDKIRELKKQLEELTSQYQKLTIENKRLQDSVRNTGYEQGQTDLWNMLQEISNYYYFGSDDEFDSDDCDMTSMTDIIDVLDVNQFLEAYKNWHKAQEQDRIDHMRDYLERFCMGRPCCKCPLHTDEFKCGRGIWFRDIADEDIQRYYGKATAQDLRDRLAHLLF